MSAKIDLEIQTGVTWRRVITWSDEYGARRSLAGLSAFMQVRERVGSAVLLDLSTADGSIAIEQDAVNDDVTGTMTVLIPGPLTADITNPKARYDLKLTTDSSEDGEPSTRLMEGLAVFNLGITKP
jgi:hypothetical protein